MQITVESLKAQGYVECPRCRMYHNNVMNPQAVTSKTRGNVSKGEQEVVTSVSYVCDKCCDQLLDAFNSSDWKLYWPTITDQEAQIIVTQIKEARMRQVMYYRRDA